MRKLGNTRKVLPHGMYMIYDSSHLVTVVFVEYTASPATLALTLMTHFFT